MKKALGLLAVFSAVLFWGVSFISASQMLVRIDPLILGFFRYILAALFVGIIVVVRRVDMRVSKADFLTFFLAGFLGIFLYSILENTALTMIPAAAASIITALTPMSMILGNLLIFRERVTFKETLLIIVSILGVVLVLFPDLRTGAEGKEWLGYALMLLSIVFWTVYSLMTKKVTQKYSSLKVTAIQSFITLALFIPTLLVAPFPDFATFQAQDWGNLLFLGVICSGVCYYLFIHSVRVLGVMLPNLLLNFIPIVTIVANGIIGHQAIDPLQIAGGIVVVLAMTALTLENFKKPKEPRGL